MPTALTSRHTMRKNALTFNRLLNGTHQKSKVCDVSDESRFIYTELDIDARSLPVSPSLVPYGNRQDGVPVQRGREAALAGQLSARGRPLHGERHYAEEVQQVSEGVGNISRVQGGGGICRGLYQTDMCRPAHLCNTTLYSCYFT